MERCLITSASNKFFPSLLNLLGSIHKNYPSHPQVFVYDLGLSYLFKKELQSIAWVTLIKMPPFVAHWRACYTWKAYILDSPLAQNNFYIDAGCQVLVPLDEIFKEISINDYFLVSQGPDVNLEYITPKDYVKIFDIKSDDLNNEVVAAGIVGFKKGSSISPITSSLKASAIAGLCLGFSPEEHWKNKGPNKTSFVRDCPRFRHDTTMISVLIRKMLPNVHLHPVEEFSGAPKMDPNDKRYIWNLRMGYKTLQYTDAHIIHEVPGAVVYLNRLWLKTFYALKEINRVFKSIKQP